MKNSCRVILVAFLVGFAVIVPSAVGQTTSAAQVNKSILVSAAMKSSVIPVGQSPILVLSITNAGDEEQLFPLERTRVYVEDQSGERPNTYIQRSLTNRLRSGERTMRGDEYEFWTIASGQTGVHSFQLSYFYDLNAIGDYTAYMEVYDAPTRKWLRTNSVVFSVVPPSK